MVCFWLRLVLTVTCITREYKLILFIDIPCDTNREMNSEQENTINIPELNRSIDMTSFIKIFLEKSILLLSIILLCVLCIHHLSFVCEPVEKFWPSVNFNIATLSFIIAQNILLILYVILKKEELSAHDIIKNCMSSCRFFGLGLFYMLALNIVSIYELYSATPFILVVTCSEFVALENNAPKVYRIIVLTVMVLASSSVYSEQFPGYALNSFQVLFFSLLFISIISKHG